MRKDEPSSRKEMSALQKDIRRIVQSITDLTPQDLDPNKLTLVYVWAPWCGPCKQMSPMIESIDKDTEWLDVLKVNADENPAIMKTYDISGVPTLLLFKKGKIVEYQVGALPKFKLMGMLKEHN